ncbi:pyrrolo-quinoline quinone [Salipaludibacillus keqinensis]|uniref:Pyrrolo-quinoline quinone n=1 Tax=Salipaludibacillus keqinensis TaxID=2045207 RepID=A0A323TUV5_9BACI|nr:PQQ-binding-like beta-propeller repeat protein [Salipaludibacillus keqinensis]PYZ93255.1 pyrrolo-quinoline quinone [Salipaludibacillus keqinensis]
MKKYSLLLVCTWILIGGACSNFEGVVVSENNKENVDKKESRNVVVEKGLDELPKEDAEGQIEEPIEELYEALHIEEYHHENIHFDINGEKELEQRTPEDSMFPEVYTEVEGVLTFRGGPLRDSPSYGLISATEMELEEQWNYRTGVNPDWGGGAGWTGQPAIVKWDNEIKQLMNIDEKFKEKDDFVEVIQGSLDGHVYFLDLETGEETRDPIAVKNPIKGSLSIDSRGYPLLYLGDGVPQHEKFGFYIFSLIDSQLLHYIPGRDEFAYRNWGAFDGSALINRHSDSLVVGGENGVFYNIALNTDFNKEQGTIAIDPAISNMRYKVEGNDHQGVENSVAIFKNIAYFADNGGSILSINLKNNHPIWGLPLLDDTDASIVVDVVEDVPHLYTGSEVDIVGENGHAYLRKIHGLTGEVIWKKSYPAFYNPDVNGGVLATPVLGKGNMENLIVFTVARHRSANEGIMVALDRKTGEEVWSWDMEQYAWSSAVDVYDDEGNGYLVQADSAGSVHIIDGVTGKVLTTKNFDYNIEASPAIYNDSIIFASRGGLIHHVKIK